VSKKNKLEYSNLYIGGEPYDG